MMKAKFAIPVIALIAALSQTTQASDQFAGLVIGGTTGAIVGHAIGGHDGAVVGGVLGAVVGAAATNDRDVRYYSPRPVMYGPPAVMARPMPPRFVSYRWRETRWDQDDWRRHHDDRFDGHDNRWGGSRDNHHH